jgi:hypothetical protein
MKKLLTIFSFFIFFLFLFLFKTNSVLAATCAASGGTCQSAQLCAVQGGGTISGTTDCTATQVCCAPNTPPACTPPLGTCQGAQACAVQGGGTISGTTGCTATQVCCTPNTPPDCVPPLGTCQSAQLCAVQGGGEVSVTTTGCTSTQVCCAPNTPAACAPPVGTCQTQQQCSSQGGSPASVTTSGCTSTQVCCAPNAPASGTIKAGATGCSLKTDGTPVDPRCESGAVCIPGAYTSYDPGSGELRNSTCFSLQNNCPICDPGYNYISSTNKCQNQANAQDTKVIIRVDTCQNGQSCSAGYGCGAYYSPAQPLSVCQGDICKTALGDLPTTPSALLTTIFGIALSIAGVVALGLIIASGYRLMVSQGNPEQVKNAREQLTAAIIGLLFIIFSLVILQIISANILKIPGFG